MTQIAPNPIDFTLGLTWSDLPAQVRLQAKLNILDTLGIGAGGLGTKLSTITRNHSAEVYGGALPMLYDGRAVSAPGWALAAGITIDSLDGHDGYNPAKGHIAAPMMPAALALGMAHGISGEEFLANIVAGYEIGGRTAEAQHGTVPDYHTSGSWGAVAAAAVGARIAGLDREQLRHAIGIAEYHGPRSQMMRCIDYPTMVKDGAGWGAMTGVSAVMMAARGFTGAPALTVEQAPDYWGDLGQRWITCQQYYKPFPVCRWAQGPIEGILELMEKHSITHDQVERIEATTFHESVRLATKTPRNTEEAQYSTSFPCAVALVKGTVDPEHIADDALNDPDVLRHSNAMVMLESDYANEHFPQRRFAKVALLMKDGRRLEGDYLEPRWSPDTQPTEGDLRAKFHSVAAPVLGAERAAAIEAAIDTLENTSLTALTDLLVQPIS